MSPSRSSPLRGRCRDPVIVLLSCQGGVIAVGRGCQQGRRHRAAVIRVIVVGIGVIMQMSSSRCHHMAVVRVVVVGVKVVVRLSLALSELWSSCHRRGRCMAVFVVIPRLSSSGCCAGLSSSPERPGAASQLRVLDHEHVRQ
jgi:hypothetical protein